MLAAMSPSDGYEPHVEQDGFGVPVVLVHGTPLDLHCWDALVPALARALRVIRYDLRGHGTAANVPVPDSFDLLADDIAALLDRLEIERAHVVGHSFGAQIAQNFALRHPDRVRSLGVLCGRATPFPAFTATAARIRAGGVRPLVESTLARWFTARTLADEARAQDVAAAVEYVRACLGRIDAEVYAASLELVAGFDVLERLPTLAARTHFIAAERDSVSTPRQLKRSSEAVPHGDLVVIAKAGHLLPLEHPVAVAETLEQSLSADG
jgi:pimeloyl-ACP methyl ester carboxylesterase